jgi:ATP-dependent Lhr-like helicase
VVWTGCGTLPGGDGWLALAPADVADLLLPEPEELEQTPLHTALLSTLDGGALFFRQLTERCGAALLADGAEAPDDGAVLTALWDLVWAGLVAGDTLAPVRAMVSGRGATHRPRRPAPRSRYARLRSTAGLGSYPGARPSMPSRTGPPTAAGRWGLAPSREADPTRRAHARAEAFLERHGVLTRGALDTERVTGGFAAVYKVLRAMEESGRCRRGYVIDGLGAAQFAVPGAIDRLRALSRHAGERDGAREGAVVLAATDPAQPYGAALRWPDPLGSTKHRPARKAGALAVLVDGLPALYVERGGRSLLSFTEDDDALLAAAAGLARAVHDGWLGSLAVERADGEVALGSRLADVLREAGFRVTPKGLRLRA